MKTRSKSFKDAVSKVLDEGSKKKKTNEELIEELYGSGSGGNYVPAGLTVASQQGTGFSRGLMPPYSSYSDAEAAGQGGIDMRDLQPDNDVERPRVAPFPLETTKDHLGDSYTKLADVVDQIKSATENSALSEEKVKLLKKLENKVKTIIGHIGKVTQEIANINLD